MEVLKVTLDQARLENGIKTAKELSEKSGISQYTLTKYNTVEGIKHITLKNLMKICTILGCTIDDIVQFTNKEEKTATNATNVQLQKVIGELNALKASYYNSVDRNDPKYNKVGELIKRIIKELETELGR